MGKRRLEGGSRGGIEGRRGVREGWRGDREGWRSDCLMYYQGIITPW